MTKEAVLLSAKESLLKIELCNDGLWEAIFRNSAHLRNWEEEDSKIEEQEGDELEEELHDALIFEEEDEIFMLSILIAFMLLHSSFHIYPSLRFDVLRLTNP